jgi:hypothetical protein
MELHIVGFKVGTGRICRTTMCHTPTHTPPCFQSITCKHDALRLSQHTHCLLHA